jgi:N-methylhydantoinase A
LSGEEVPEADRGICIGIDVGGTFTDCVLTEGDTVWRAKAPSTPGSLGDGVLAAARLAAERRGASLEATLRRTSRFGLGTTAVTNALASRSGSLVGLLTTAGFEEMLTYARGTREVAEDGYLKRPDDMVPPNCIRGIAERVDRHGEVVTPLDVAEVEVAARALVEEEGVEAIAVSFLWSFLNPVHEEQATAVVRKCYPELTVVSGAELHPAQREYERTTFAVMNAYVAGAIDGIEELEAALGELGLGVPVLLVHSGGGSVTVAEARRRPLGLAASGPTAGVSASVAVAEAAGRTNVLTCDMGGTSFDVSVVDGGVPARRHRGDLMGVWTALSLIDVESIGAGGGSLGWVDARGMLRVGPRSAGAVPGPACYGRGGEQATVTDALVVLGYIAPDRFLGGEFSLDAEAAREACTRLGHELGLGVDDVAWGIRELALAGMGKAVRARTSALGLDPRRYALLSFGGSGSLFTPDIARAIGSSVVLVPELASVLSAFGAATTDVRRERLRAVGTTFPLASAEMALLTAELEAGVREDLTADGIAPGRQSVEFEADLRFAKQTFEIPIPFAAPALADGGAGLLADFNREYAKRYGQGSMMLGLSAELVAVRAVGIGATTRAALHPRGRGAEATEGAPAPSAERRVRVARGASGLRVVPSFDARALAPGHRLEGPALVDGSDMTVWLPKAWSATVDPFANLVLEVPHP